MLRNKLPIIVFLFFLSACSSTHKTGRAEQSGNSNENKMNSETVVYTGPPTIIYKTANDYKKNIAVQLSDDKTKIVSYPAPADVLYKGSLAYPTELSKGFLLDNRGISINTAFTKYTFEEYSKLKTAPDLQTLFTSIIDKNPIVEMYNCGNRNNFKNEVSDLNNIIENNKLSNYKKIK